MSDDTRDKGFTVVDRRIAAEDSAPAAPAARPEAAGPDACNPQAVADARKEYEERRGEEEVPISFPSLLLSLHTSALIHLGLIPDPGSQKAAAALGMARQDIGLLEMLKDKTKGNLTPQEDNLIDNILYELRLTYVDVAKAEGKKGEGK